MHTFEISGVPVAKARPRGYKTKQNSIRFYTPVKSQRFENLVRERAEKVFDSPLMGPLYMRIFFRLPRPKRLIWKRRVMPSVPCDKRPDLSNLIKSVEDGLNGIAYLDDAQITRLHVTKVYHAGDEGPKTVITIGRLDEYERV